MGQTLKTAYINLKFISCFHAMSLAMFLSLKYFKVIAVCVFMFIVSLACLITIFHLPTPQLCPK